MYNERENKEPNSNNVENPTSKGYKRSGSKRRSNSMG